MKSKSGRKLLFALIILIGLCALGYLAASQPQTITPDQLIYPNYEAQNVTVTGYVAVAPTLIIPDEQLIYFPMLAQEPYASHDPAYVWQFFATTTSSLKGQTVLIFTDASYMYMYQTKLQKGHAVTVTGMVYYTPASAGSTRQPYLIASAIGVA